MQSDNTQLDYDVVVLGSGGAGLTSAVVAASAGLKVLVVEKTHYYGGATAWSGGGLWVPNTSMARHAGFQDSVDEAELFLKGMVGQDLRQDLVTAFLGEGPKMIDFMERLTEVRFALSPGSPDWSPDLPGAKLDGRLLGPVAYNGLLLGPYLEQLRPPIQEFNAPGGFMIDFADLPHLANVKKSLKSATYMGRHVAHFVWDKMNRRRGTRLTMGNALAGRLIKSALNRGVTFWRDATAGALVRDGDAVIGITVTKDGRTHTVTAHHGVVLATGGFSANATMRAEYIPHADKHVSIMPEGNTGDGLALAETAGGRLDGRNIANAAWSTISKYTRPDGSTAKYAHLLDMAKPGCIAVKSDGRRFANEASDLFVEAMHRNNAVPSHIICDAAFLKKYGMGLVFPGAMGLKKLKQIGYITEAPDLASLARAIGIDPDGLAATVARVNREAPDGRDIEFGKGENVVDRSIGDPTHLPNPCWGPIGEGPFYAIAVYPGDGSTTVGLRVDDQARVLGENDRPIRGLYACGLDMNSLWRGRPPAHGANNGLNMTFGYIAGQSLVATANEGTKIAEAAD